MGTKYVDPAMGFMMGINAFLSVAFGIPTELTAIASLFTYWDHNIGHAAAYITAFLVLTVLVNILGVRYYGEIEFFFACLKVSTLLGLMLFALIDNLGGVPTNKRYIGGRYWREEPFNNSYLGIKPKSLSNFCGFWAVFTGAAFAYSAIESVAVMGGEAHNPRRSIAKAIKTTFLRILFIYVIGTLMISLNVSFKDPLLLSEIEKDSGNAGSSPWVIMCKNAGVQVLPHLINGVVITSALSSGNEQLYVLSRLLMALARERQLPRVFMRTTRNGIPWAGVIVGAAFACLGYLSVSNGSNQAFIWLSNLSALSALITWSGIAFAYIRFRKACLAQGVDRTKFTYRGYFQPFLAYYTIALFMLVLITNGFRAWIPTFSVSDFFASYITIPVVIICFVGWKVAKKTKMVPIDEIDLSKGPSEALRGTRYDTMSPNYAHPTYA
jgi:amino acid transporter